MTCPVLESVLLDDAPNPETPADWLWHGYLARGSVTLLTSLWKAGKTTLLSVLLARMREGGLFANRPIQAGRAVIVTEESAQLWQRRKERLAFGADVRFYFQPFGTLPTFEEWKSLIASLVQDRERHQIDLVVIDTLGASLPAGAENFRDGIMQALLPLASLKSAGMSVLLMHHPRKQKSAVGRIARGSGALAGFADIVLEMKALGRPTCADRRRRIVALSRYSDTPRDLIIELNAEGTDYIARGALEDDECRRFWPVVAKILEGANRKLTRMDVLERWPTPDNQPHAATVWRWLEWGVEQKLLLKEGEGHRNRPFRYWLADREVVPGYLADLPELGDLPPERLAPR